MVHKYPIILGPGHRKGVIVGRSRYFDSGRDLFVVRLNKDVQSGARFYEDDIESVEALMHFCDRESIQRTIDVLTEALARWKEEDPK